MLLDSVTGKIIFISVKVMESLLNLFQTRYIVF